MVGMEMVGGGGRSGFTPKNLGLTPNSPLRVTLREELGNPKISRNFNSLKSKPQRGITNLQCFK